MKAAPGRRPIRILYILDVLLGWAGTEKHLFNLATRFERNRFQSYVFAFEVTGKMLAAFNAAGIETHHLPVSRIYGRSALEQGRRLYQFIRQNEIDIVQTFNFGGTVFGTTVARLAGVRAVITCKRDLGFQERRWHDMLLRLVDHGVERTVCNSAAVRDELVARRVIDPAKTVVIYNGVELGEYSRAVTDVAGYRRQIGLAAEQPVVSMVANLRPVKDMETFLEAARLVLDRGVRAQFIIAGGDCPLDGKPTTYQQELERHVQRLGLEGRIHFVGVRTDVPELLSASDVCVLTSLSEGFSNTVVEYMAAGKPVVATSVGGNVEAVADGETGFIVPVGRPDRVAEAILTLLTDRDSACRMGQAGRHRVEQLFAMNRMVQQFEVLYESACG
jgi:glycosyltransferase involved in cell wall biosynthesis